MFGKELYTDSALESLLGRMDNDALRIFADLLVYNKDNQPRISETLTANRLYKLYYPKDMKRVIPELIHEFQLYGGDSIANFLRGHGVSYEEILKDLCSKYNAKVRDNYGIEQLELTLVNELMESILEKSNRELLFELVGDLNIDVSLEASNEELCQVVREAFSSSPMLKLVILKCILRSMCPQIEAFATDATVDVDGEKAEALWGAMSAAAFGVGGRFAAAAIGQFALRLVPVINVLTIAWFITFFTGANSKVTLPCTLFLIYQRIKLSASSHV